MILNISATGLRKNFEPASIFLYPRKRERLAAILDGSVFAPTDTASTPAEARAVARERAYDLLFINAQAADFMCAAAERLRRERKTAGTVERHIAESIIKTYKTI